MASSWLEVDKAKEECRHELVLTGDAVATRIAEGGLDERIFALTALNFLEISRCGLAELPRGVAQLTGLSNLVLHDNRLGAVPDEIGQLSRLKFLDLSCNELELLPPAIGQLCELQVDSACHSQFSLWFWF